MRTNTATDKNPAGDAPLNDDAGRHCCQLRAPYLDKDECDEEDKCKHKQGDNASIVPLPSRQHCFHRGPVTGNTTRVDATYRVGEASPLQRQAQADIGGKQSCDALGIQLLQLLHKLAGLVSWATWHM